MHTVIETTDFIKDAKSCGLSDEERKDIIDHIANNPTAGDEMAGTGGARKLRFAAKNKGKSGGVRVITFYSGTDVPVFLLNVFTKSEKINLTKAECNALKIVLNSVADAYRKKKE